MSSRFIDFIINVWLTLYNKFLFIYIYSQPPSPHMASYGLICEWSTASATQNSAPPTIHPRIHWCFVFYDFFRLFLAKKLDEQCFYHQTCYFSDENSLCVQIKHNARCQCATGYHKTSFTKPTKRIFCTPGMYM